MKIDPSEQTLIAAMLEGDEAAFNSFFDIYSSRVYQFALPRLGGDVEAAEEVVQSTLVKAMRSLRTFRGEAALFSWLCQICRHQAVDYLRRNRRHTRQVVRIDDNAQLRAALVAIEAPATDDPLHCCDASETRRLVQSVLAELPSRYAELLHWKYIEERSVADIGEKMGIGYSAAESVLARARTAFRGAMETVFGSRMAQM
jgi:RNA polymerase sigma-70 factor (ECF subfamily)